MAQAKTVIVTGAGSGIGAACARRFSADGWNVALFARTRDKLEKIAADLPDDRTLVIDGDIRDSDAVTRLVSETVNRFGGLDALVNNAGVGAMGAPGELSRDAWDRVLAVNVTGVFEMTTAALPHLKKTGGCVVNTASVSGLGGDWRMFGYNASKGAVANMTRAMALDLAPEVRVNAVAPSLTRTDMAAGVLDKPDRLDAFAERIPMGRPGEPEEVADVIAFLASHDARFVTGVVLPVDGGLSASNGQPRLG